MERFIPIFNNTYDAYYNELRRDGNRYIRNLHNNLYNPRVCISLLDALNPFSRDEIVLTPLILDEQILLPTFVEQEFLIPDDTVCGITFEIPECCTPCGHYFCRADITKWLEQQKNEGKKMTCPTCRATISEVLVAKNK